MAPAQKLLALRGMGHPLRWFLPGMVYEVTTRTLQERYLLRPGIEARALILGVLGRGLTLFPSVALHAFAYLSNHGHILVSSTDGHQLMQFLGYVNGNVARKVGRLHGWRGAFWGRRHRPIPVVDDQALVERLRYVLAQGVKEGLVAHPEEWPGASSTKGLLGERLIGRWVHRDLEARALRAKRPAAPSTYTLHYDVPLTPLPCWRDLTEAQRVARVQELIDDVVAEARHTRGGASVGAEALCREDPHHRPEQAARAPAPVCHAATAAVRTAFRAAYRTFVDAFRRAAALVATRVAVSEVPFPAGSFPRSGRCIPHAPGGASLWQELEVGAVQPWSGGGRGTA